MLTPRQRATLQRLAAQPSDLWVRGDRLFAAPTLLHSLADLAYVETKWFNAPHGGIGYRITDEGREALK